MQLRTFAEIATIAALAVALLSYMKIEPNILDRMPKSIEKKASEDVKKSEFKIEESDYGGEKASIYRQYIAALAMADAYDRSSALSKVVEAALVKDDFKIAIMAGKGISDQYTQGIMLSKIVDAALDKNDSAGYAVVSADWIKDTYTKDVALKKIISFYGSGGKVTNRTPLDDYKDIFTFSYSAPGMNMGRDKAKEFADSWVKNRSYSEFLYFKDVFLFADETSGMNMNSRSAEDFALSWIGKYSREQFKIFRDAYVFADSVSGMNMSAEDAKAFAFQKLLEPSNSAPASSVGGEASTSH